MKLVPPKFRVSGDHVSRKRTNLFGASNLWRAWEANFAVDISAICVIRGLSWTEAGVSGSFFLAEGDTFGFCSDTTHWLHQHTTNQKLNMNIFKKNKARKTTTSTQDSVSASRHPAVTAAVARASTTPASGANRQVTTECIASRAYALWEQAGCPQGRDLEHWLQAESQLKESSQSFSA